MKNIIDRPPTLLAQLIAHSRNLQQVQTWLQQCLPPPLSHQVRVANYRDKTLFVQVDNGAVASRLRFLMPDLLRQLSQTPFCLPVEHVEVRVRRWEEPPRVEKKPLPYSKKAALIIENSAKTISYEPLRVALFRLASHVKK